MEEYYTNKTLIELNIEGDPITEVYYSKIIVHQDEDEETGKKECRYEQWILLKL